MGYANVTAARDQGVSVGDVISLLMDAVAIYKGSLVYADASAGYCTYTPTASRPFFGVAYETVDNSAGSAGDLAIRVWATGVHNFIAASADQTWIGKEVWGSIAANPQTVVVSDPGAGAVVGRVVEVVSATEVRVKIDGYALKTDVDAS